MNAVQIAGAVLVLAGLTGLAVLVRNSLRGRRAPATGRHHHHRR